MSESSRSRKNRKTPTKRYFMATLLGRYLKNVRTEKKLSQDQAGKILNTNNTKVARIELGEVLVSDADLLAYSKAWQLDLTMLKALRDRKPEVAKRSYKNVPHVIEAFKEMSVHNRVAAHVKVMSPANTRECRAEAMRLAQQANAQLTLPNIPTTIAAVEASVPAPEVVASWTTDPFLCFLIDKHAQLPCPQTKAGREAWLTAMSGMYDVSKL